MDFGINQDPVRMLVESLQKYCGFITLPCRHQLVRRVSWKSAA